MVGTILPVGYGERQRGELPITIWLHGLANVAGAASVGAVLGMFGGLLPWHGRLGSPPFVLLSIGLVSLLYSLEEVQLVPMPKPQLRRQVPSWWRRSFPPRTAAILYGLELGEIGRAHV